MENGTTAVEKAKSSLQKAASKGNLAGMKQSEVQDVLQALKPQIIQALPKHLTADRMIQMATKVIANNPKIAECSLESLVAAVMSASILGFKPVSELGECYFVPYKKVVQMQIGYKGYISLARRSGEIKMIYAEIVRGGDFEFIYELGLEPKLIHKPNPDASGEMTHVYAVAHYKDGGFNFVVLTKKQVEKLRVRNYSQKDGVVDAWKTDYEAMAKAKAIKQLAKYLPMSDEKIDTALRTDEGVLSFQSFANDQTGEIESVDFPQLDESKEIAENSENPNDYGK